MRIERSFRPMIVRALPTAAVLSMLAGTASAQFSTTFQTVIRTNEAVPGVAGATWNSASAFSSGAVIDNSGNVAFRGQMTSGVGGVVTTGGANQNGLWYGGPGTLSLFARDGAAGPTAANPNNWVFNAATGGSGLGISVSNSSNGVLSFGSLLNGTGAVTNSNNSAFWAGPAASPQLVAQRGVSPAAAPGTTGAAFATNLNFSLAPRVNNAGQAMFASALSGGDSVSGTWSIGNLTNDSGVWIGSPGAGNISIIAREGDAAPGIAGTIFGELGTVQNTQLNAGGQVAFTSALRVGFGGVSSTSGSANDMVLWTNAGGSALAAVARKSDPVPGLPGVFYANTSGNAFTTGLQALNNSGRLVYDATFGTGATAANSEALMTWQGGVANIMFRTSDAAPGIAGATFTSFNGTNTQLRLNNNNFVAFSGSVTGGVSTANDEGIWAGIIGSTPQLIAREGDQVPGMAAGVLLGGALINASAPMLNNLNQIVFQGTLTGAGVTTSNDQCVFAWDPTLGLTVLLREGDTSIAGLGTLGNTTVTISPFSYTNSGNGNGGSQAFSDTGWLTLVARDTAGNYAVVRALVPTPGTVALAFLGGTLVARRRRG
ncbi:MAG: DUF7453 family protein [Phycisphaerales bacterium]